MCCNYRMQQVAASLEAKTGAGIPGNCEGFSPTQSIAELELLIAKRKSRGGNVGIPVWMLDPLGCCSGSSASLQPQPGLVLAEVSH